MDRDKYDEMAERLLPCNVACDRDSHRATCPQRFRPAVAAELRQQHVAGLAKAKEVAERLASLGDKIIVVDWLLKEIDKEISRAVLEDDDG